MSFFLPASAKVIVAWSVGKRVIFLYILAASVKQDTHEPKTHPGRNLRQCEVLAIVQTNPRATDEVDISELRYGLVEADEKTTFSRSVRHGRTGYCAYDGGTGSKELIRRRQADMAFSAPKSFEFMNAFNPSNSRSTVEMLNQTAIFKLQVLVTLRCSSALSHLGRLLNVDRMHTVETDHTVICR